jgi:hypothetical protein
MKPRLKLHRDGSVSLAAPPPAYKFNISGTQFMGSIAADNIRDATGSVKGFCDSYGIPYSLMVVALKDGRNKGFAMGGASGSIRAMLGLPVCSSANSKALCAEVRVPLAAVRIARGEWDAKYIANGKSMQSGGAA